MCIHFVCVCQWPHSVSTFDRYILTYCTCIPHPNSINIHLVASLPRPPFDIRSSVQKYAAQ